MSLYNLIRGQSPIASLFKCNFGTVFQQLIKFQLAQCIARSYCDTEFRVNLKAAMFWCQGRF